MMRHPTRPFAVAVFAVSAFFAVSGNLVWADEPATLRNVPAQAGPAEVAAPTREQMLGFWYVAKKDVVVEIFACNRTTNTPAASGAPISAVCGRIAWIEKPFDANGKLLTDVKNPDRALRMQPLCKLDVLWGLEPDPKKPGRWREGKAYVANRGLKVNPRVDQASEDEIKVRGSIGPFGLTETWTRAPRDRTWQCPDPAITASVTSRKRK